jgi:hypothetical protein
MAEDEALRARLGPAGKAYITEYFRADRTVADLAAAYEVVLGR